ncbi:GNAT family N-acetyltransferase [Actinoplanes sp. NPDC089786]|uniref:GNAT family N-acetyltransferase n=1 Tax=Actinoplanes sp. NPDC089786 TaxID=3155185 RepID=UPI003442E099
MTWSLRPAEPADIEPLADLRAEVMRADLTRLGRYDDHRVRQRLRDAFTPSHTSIIEIAAALAGSITLRPAADRHWLEHFYLAPQHQGQGLGSAILEATLARARHATVSLIVLQGSPARRLYERHGFRYESEDPIDVTMTRQPL